MHEYLANDKLFINLSAPTLICSHLHFAVTCCCRYMLLPLHVAAVTCCCRYMLLPLHAAVIICCCRYMLLPLHDAAVTCMLLPTLHRSSLQWQRQWAPICRLCTPLLAAISSGQTFNFRLCRLIRESELKNMMLLEPLLNSFHFSLCHFHVLVNSGHQHIYAYVMEYS